MFRLALILHLFIGTTLSGSAMIAALTAGYGTLQPLMFSALVGFALSLPVTWAVTRAIYRGRTG